MRGQKQSIIESLAKKHPSFDWLYQDRKDKKWVIDLVTTIEGYLEFDSRTDALIAWLLIRGRQRDI